MMSDSGSPDCDYHEPYALEGIDQNDLEAEAQDDHNSTKHSRGDDEALSSLLLLLKSNNNKDEDGDVNLPDGDIPVYSMPLLYNGIPFHPEHNTVHHPPQIYLHDESSYAKTITIDDLRRYFHLPIADVAKQLGTCTTAFKKICRKNNINRWPYRQIRGLTKNIHNLEQAVLQQNLPTDLQNAYVSQMIEHRNAINELIRNPNTIVTVHKRKRVSEEQDDVKRRRPRDETSYAVETGWVADCSKCGKLGKYRPPSEGRPFQHSTGMGKYCGYFRVNPRQRQEDITLPMPYEYMNPTPQQEQQRQPFHQQQHEQPQHLQHYQQQQQQQQQLQHQYQQIQRHQLLQQEEQQARV